MQYCLWFQSKSLPEADVLLLQSIDSSHLVNFPWCCYQLNEAMRKRAGGNEGIVRKRGWGLKCHWGLRWGHTRAKCEKQLSEGMEKRMEALERWCSCWRCPRVKKDAFAFFWNCWVLITITLVHHAWHFIECGGIGAKWNFTKQREKRLKVLYLTEAAKDGQETDLCLFLINFLLRTSS